MATCGPCRGGRARILVSAFGVCLVACGYTADYRVAESGGGPTSGQTADSRIETSGALDGGGGENVCPPSVAPSVFDACPDVCTGGCDRITGTCAIDCDANQECKESELRCPDGFACDVRCTGESSCEKSKLVCPPDEPCQIQCLGKVSCREAHVTCEGGTCDITCDADACHDAVISCGLGACRTSCPGEAPKSQTCGEACECTAC